MAVVKRANILRSAIRLVEGLISSSHEKLVKFCTKRVIDTGLAAQSYPHQFLFTNSSHTKKSISKLKTLFQKHVLKEIPYVAFASEEFMQIRNRESLTIVLGKSEEMDVIDPDIKKEMGAIWARDFDIYTIYNNSTYSESYRNLYKGSKSIDRYCRYLNYIFRKNHIPVRARVSSSINFNTSDTYEARQKNSIDRKKAKIRHTIEVSIELSLGKWYLRSGFHENYINALTNPDAYETLSSAHSLWAFGHWENSSTYYPQYFRYSSEKIFLHIDKASKIFKTLTRKVSYGSAAFTFRDI